VSEREREREREREKFFYLKKSFYKQHVDLIFQTSIETPHPKLIIIIIIIIIISSPYTSITWERSRKGFWVDVWFIITMPPPPSPPFFFPQKHVHPHLNPTNNLPIHIFYKIKKEPKNFF
jgi:hypothetical protein